jgi:hypothetical protein
MFADLGLGLRTQQVVYLPIRYRSPCAYGTVNLLPIGTQWDAFHVYLQRNDHGRLLQYTFSRIQVGHFPGIVAS